MNRKRIIYNCDTHDFAIYLDQQLVGYAASYLEAETVIDQLLLELLRGRHQQHAA